MAKANGKSSAIDLTQSVIMLTAEIASMRADMETLPERTAGRAVELLFQQLRGLNKEDFLKLKFASTFEGLPHDEAVL